jgi:hypothetical protein
MSFKEFLKESSLTKSSWGKLIDDLQANGLMYNGAFYTKDGQSDADRLQEIVDSIDKNGSKVKFEVNRTYETGKSSIGMKTEKGSVSYIDKRGTVYDYKSFYIVQDKSTIVLYKHK